MLRIVRTAGAIAFYVLLGVIVTAVSYHWFVATDNQIPVMVIEQYSLESDHVKAGDDLIVRFTMTRNEECHALTYRFIVDNADDVLAWGSVIAPILQKVGAHQTGAVRVHVPEQTPPGSYRYQTVTFNTNCARGRTYTASSPILNFTVMSKDQ